MVSRYKIRMYESADGDGSMAAGRIVIPIDRSFSVYGETADEIERQIGKEVVDGKLSTRRVYQICPQLGNAELMRSIAIDEDSNAQPVFLDAATGLYSEFRRIRYPRLELDGHIVQAEAIEA